MKRAPLILIPGIICDRTVWEPQIAALADLADMEVAEHDASDSLGALAQRLLRRAPERFALAGHSMGGRIALEVMRRAPERVTKLALMDTGFEARRDGKAGETETAGRYRLLEIARTQGMRAMGTQWLQKMIHPDRCDDMQITTAILDMIERVAVEKYAAQIQALLHRQEALSVLTQIRCPTLILCGREDAWSPLQRHQQMNALIPGSHLIVIEHCGHMSTLERPQQVADAMRKWMEEEEVDSR